VLARTGTASRTALVGDAGAEAAVSGQWDRRRRGRALDSERAMAPWRGRVGESTSRRTQHDGM